MKIAVITGASSGLGTEYTAAVARRYRDLDEIWVIARRADRLEDLRRTYGEKIRPLALDLTDEAAFATYAQLLADEKPQVALLINNAGFGKLGNFDTLLPEQNAGMVRLNCEALTRLTSLTVPYLSGGGLLNVCSIAAFAPNTRMAVYCSTKAYVMSLTRCLAVELKPKGIRVTAVCPGPMDTEFLPVANIGKGDSKTFDTLPRVLPKAVAEQSLTALEKGKGIVTNRYFYKFYRVVAKILPTAWVMKFCGA